MGCKMKDLTHYFQSPSREDDDTEADILLSIDASPSSKKTGNASAVKNTVPSSQTHVIVSCDSDGDTLAVKKKKRKSKNSRVILDVTTVGNKSKKAETIIISASETETTPQHQSRGTVKAKNSSKTYCNENLKRSGHVSKCSVGTVLNTSLERRTTKSTLSKFSNNSKQLGPDAFEVLMSVRVRNVDDECVSVENEPNRTNICTSDKDAGSNTATKESKSKRKHNLEEMARRNRKRKSSSSDDHAKKKCKKWKRVVFDDSESEDFHSEFVGPSAEGSDDGKENAACEMVSEGAALVQNTNDAKVEPPLVANITEGKSVVLEPDKNSENSSCDLVGHDILVAQYEKTLKHVRKAEKALRKFEKLKSLQEQKGSPTNILELEHKKMSAIKMNLKCIDKHSDGEEINSDKKHSSRRHSSKTAPSSDSESKKQDVPSTKVTQRKEMVSTLSDDDSDIFENCVETKKKSIFSYFTKVSKEEVLTKAQKLSVHVLIHSPPTTPMKKKTRKTGSAIQISNQKRKVKRYRNQKEVPDKIDLLSSEIVEILDCSSVEEETGLTRQAGDGERRNSLRSWKVRMVPDTPSAVADDTDSRSDQDQVSVEMLDSSDSVFTPPKKRRDVTCVGGRRPRKVRAQIDEKVTCTPKDSRRLAMKNSAGLEDKHPSPINEVAVIGIEDEQKDQSSEKFQESSVASPKAAVKLAPLFRQEKTKKQNKVDQAVIEARKNFLMSGVPDAVQKMINIQKSFEEHSCDIFPEVSHVQQKDDSDYIWNLPHDDSLVLKPEPAVDPGPTESSKLLKLGMFTNTESVQVNVEKQSPPPPITAFRKILREMKREFPDFPMYRMFRALRSKFLNGSVAPSEAEVSGQSTRKTKRRGRNAKSSKQDSAATPSLLQAHVVWAEKYRPVCVDDMFSNLASVRQLKTWLESWKKFVAEMNAAETATNLDGSGEESFIGDDENSGSEHSAMPSNTTILVGPVGCGKTAAVYAVASELDCKVLEINASSKRTGKRVLSEFLEATQSHQVRKSSEQSAAGIKGFFKEDSTTKSRKKHSKGKETVQTHTEDNNCKKLSIILVEDVDLVFEDQDDGFTSALTLLLTSSKRPVILTTSDPSCLHLSKLMQQYCVLQFVPPSAKLISVWLQLVSLLEGNRFSNLALRRLFEASGSDMRKTIHNLQFWAQMSGGCVDSKERLRALADSPQLPETSVGTEDDSKLVWASSKNVDEREAEPAPVCDVVLASSFRNLPLPCSVLGVLWWNVGSLLGVCVPRNQRLPTTGGSAEQDNFFSECCTTENEEIDALKKCNVEIVQDKCGDSVDIDEELQSVASDECPEKCSPGDTQNADSRQSPQRSSLRTQVDSLSRLMDDLSDACFVYSSCLRNDAIDLEPCMRPWEQTVKDSISLKDDDRVCSFSEKNTSDGLCCYLFQESVEQCRVSLARAANKESELHKLDWADALPPPAEKLRWRAQKHKADDSALAAVSLSSHLDRSAVALDYNPLLRAIGRQEKSRLAVNAKRKNRFFHYLKGLGIDTTESVLNLMCSSFEDS